MLKYFINDVAQTVRSDFTPIVMAEEQRFNSWQGQTFHLFSAVSRPTLKQPECEADHLHLMTRLRLSGAIPTFQHMPLRCVQVQFRLTLTGIQTARLLVDYSCVCGSVYLNC